MNLHPIALAPDEPVVYVSKHRDRSPPGVKSAGVFSSDDSRPVLINPRGEVSRLFPPEWARALREALQFPTSMRIERIDKLTDQMAAVGLVRPRFGAATVRSASDMAITRGVW